MKKALALILALVLCVGVLAACDQKPAETTAPPAEGTTAPGGDGTTAPVEEAYSFEGKKLDVFSGHGTALDAAPLTGFIEDALGLDIVWQDAPSDGMTVLFTEKVTPSLVFTTARQGNNEMGRDGALVNLWEHQDIMPNFFAHFNAEENAAYKETYMASETELYSAPVYLNGDVQRFGWLYREDIFTELNIEVPTDWDSFYAALKTMKDAYPKSYPFTMRNLTGNLTGLTELAQQWGVNYTPNKPTMDATTGTYFDASTTNEMRELLKKFKILIDEGLMDKACMSYTTAEWQQAFTTGHAFITHDKAFQLGNLEDAGKQANPDFSLSWFNNIPMVESDLPYATRDSGVQNYCWYVTTRCADVELALRYLDWLYSEEGTLITSWGVEGVSYEVDENGNKYYKEDFDSTYMARYQECGYIDMAATAAAYSEKTQAMIFDTMEAAANGGFMPQPIVTWNDEEQPIIDMYHQGWLDNRNAYLQKFLVGDLDVTNDTVWQEFVDSTAPYHIDEIIACYNAAYARMLAGEK